jgi:large subunit ribosomal protein L3
LATEEQKNKPEVEEKDVNSSEKVVETAIELSTEEVEESTEAITEDAENAPEEASSNTGSADFPFVIGKKAGMTRIFDENGCDYPTTVIEIEPCYVTQIKTLKNDGYSSVQLGFNEISDRKVKHSQKGHLSKSGVSGLRNFKEFRTETDSDVKLGAKVDASIFELGDFVAVTGT